MVSVLVYMCSLLGALDSQSLGPGSMPRWKFVSLFFLLQLCQHTTLFIHHQVPIPYINIFIPGYLEQIDAPTLGFSVYEVLQNLTSVRNATMQATLQQDIDQLMEDTRNIENMVIEINTKLVS